MITIQLKLYATLQRFHQGNQDAFQVQEGATVRQIVQFLAIPEKEVKLIFVNGRKQPLDTPLNPGDRVGLFPPVGGG